MSKYIYNIGTQHTSNKCVQWKKNEKKDQQVKQNSIDQSHFWPAIQQKFNTRTGMNGKDTLDKTYSTRHINLSSRECLLTDKQTVRT